MLKLPRKFNYSCKG